MFSFRGANARVMHFSRGIKAKISAARMVLFSGYYLLLPAQAEFTLKAAAFAKSSGALVLFDPSPMCPKIDKAVLAEALQYTDILLPNESELDYLEEFAGSGGLTTSIIAVKKGKSGAALYIKKQAPMPDGSAAPVALALEAEAFPVKALDSTGAGDAFNAGLIASFLRGDAPVQWLENGNKTASRVVAMRGGSLG
jgi:sugar/nucleoside kinase (ribokinase family)